MSTTLVPQRFKVRASSWGRLFDCAFSWEGIFLENMRNPVGLRAVLGTALHASSAAFDQSRIDGTGLSANDAMAVLVDKLHHPEGDVDYGRDDMSLKEAETIGKILHGHYCADISPRFRFRAVELTTKPFVIDCGGGIEIELTGTLDRSRQVDGSNGAGISDMKSGANAVEAGVCKTNGHRAQVGTYEILYEHTTGISITEPASIIGCKTSGRPDIKIGHIHNARQTMIGTDKTPGLLEFAAEMFRSGLFPPNPQSMLCAERYCARWHKCPYRDGGK